MPMFGGLEMVIILGVVLLVASLTRRRREEPVRALPRGPRGPRRPVPPPLPAGRVRSRPTVSVMQFVFALIFSPFVLFYWLLASLGDLVAAPVHVAVGCLTGLIALVVSLVGGQPRRLWRVAARQFARAGAGLWNTFLRLLSAYGLGGLVDRVREDARMGDDRREDRREPPRRPVAAPKSYPFEDRYRIESTLGGGGSTARLFVVRRVVSNRPVGDRLVLKYFDTGLGSRLEEVIRESRGMQVAKEMGVVLDHHLASDHFYYVMPYYEGETLTRAAARIHRGLRPKEEMTAEDMATCLGWVSELLRILDGYHRHGVIHKDVKPDNVIVTESGIRLVDLGLLTPVASALTLTTHGTEYFRDPEMVKLAVQGKRVRDVEAVRFDIYSAGAVTYFLLEGSFPACGPLSRFSRTVPMPLSVIVSRAMAEGTKRYDGIAAMRADLEVARRALESKELASLPVNRLPSMGGGGGEGAGVAAPPPPPPPVAGVAAPVPTRPARGGGLRRVVVTLLAMGLLAGLALAWFGNAKPAPPAPAAANGPSAAPHALLTGEAAAAAVVEWRAELADRLARTGAPGIEHVPVLVVANDNLAFADVAREVERSLAEEDVPHHPSTTLKRKVRGILEGAPAGAGVAEAVAAAAAPDEPPIVLWIRDLGFSWSSGRRRAALRFLYGEFTRERELDLPSPGPGEEVR